MPKTTLWESVLKKIACRKFTDFFFFFFYIPNLIFLLFIYFWLKMLKKTWCKSWYWQFLHFWSSGVTTKALNLKVSVLTSDESAKSTLTYYCIQWGLRHIKEDFKHDAWRLFPSWLDQEHENVHDSSLFVIFSLVVNCLKSLTIIPHKCLHVHSKIQCLWTVWNYFDACMMVKSWIS